MTGRFQYQLFYSNKILLDAHPSSRFLTLADFTAYVTAQDLVSDTYTDQAKWAKMAIMNIARFKSVVGKTWKILQLFVLVPVSSALIERLPSMRGKFGEWSQGEEILKLKYMPKVNPVFLTSWEKLPDPHGLGQGSKENTPE